MISFDTKIYTLDWLQMEMKIFFMLFEPHSNAMLGKRKDGNFHNDKRMIIM